MSDLAYLLDSVTLTYGREPSAVSPLRDVDMQIGLGECVALMGPSGSGKTSLLHLLAGLRAPSAGRVLFEGRDLANASEATRARLRGRRIGMVFQDFHLLPELDACENVQTPAWFSGLSRERSRERALDLLENVGLGGRASHLPSQLSGGEKQRVAIARGLVNDPAVILADEPTGNLDAATTDAIAGQLAGLARSGRTVVIATHDERVASHADRIVTLSWEVAASRATCPEPSPNLAPRSEA
jgi:putative ABC transport system ATP-binding protein